MLIMIAGGFVALAHWSRSAFLGVMAGLVAIVAGTEYVARDPAAWTNLAVGVAIVSVGVYELVMVGVDLFKGQ